MSGETEPELRPMESADGPAIAALDRASPDTGSVAFSTRYLFDPYESFVALHPDAIGVVAQAPGRAGIVGMGAASLGRCRYGGDARGFAYLFGISVHPAYRKRGIAKRMYSWLIESARSRLGGETIVVAGIQAGNEGSLRAARSWSSRIERVSVARMSTTRSRPPRPTRGIEVRPAEGADWAEIASRQDAFYGAYDLYPLRTAERLAAEHGAEAFGVRLRRYFVALDSRGAIVAGLSVTDEGSVEPMAIERIPRALRVANAVLRVLPGDGVMKRLVIRDLWFVPGRSDAAASVWESVRWLMRARGTMMMTLLDGRSPLSGAIRGLPFVSAAPGYLALLAPPDEGRLLYHPG